VFSFITTKLLAYVCGALLVALVITGGFAGCEHHNAAAARADRDVEISKRQAAETQRDEVVKVNSTQHETIGQLNAAVDQWVQKCAVSDDVNATLADLAKKNAKLDELLTKMTKLEVNDDGNVECEALQRTDYQRVCPGHARSLRGYEDRLSRSPGRSEGAGIRGPAGGPP
jgi:hypothetical protein